MSCEELNVESLYPNLPDEKYNIVLADPPWPYYGDPDKMGAAGKEYELLTFEQLAAFPMRELMYEEESALFLWMPSTKMIQAADLLRAWDLHFRNFGYVWLKTRKSDDEVIIGMGPPPTFTKFLAEFVLVATPKPNGRPFPLQSYNQDFRILDDQYSRRTPVRVEVHAHDYRVWSPRGKHSEKPAEIRTKIGELFEPDLSCIELFARTEAGMEREDKTPRYKVDEDGWTIWGAEV